MKRFLLFAISGVVIFSACSTLPVTRYSNAYKEPGFGVGLDVAMGRELSMGISSDGSTYEDDSLEYWYPLIGISGCFNFSLVFISHWVNENGKIYFCIHNLSG